MLWNRNNVGALLSEDQTEVEPPRRVIRRGEV